MSTTYGRCNKCNKIYVSLIEKMRNMVEFYDSVDESLNDRITSFTEAESIYEEAQLPKFANDPNTEVVAHLLTVRERQTMSYANDVASLVREFVEGPPEAAPGSLVAGSAAEEAARERWRLRLLQQAKELGSRRDDTGRGVDLLMSLISYLLRG